MSHKLCAIWAINESVNRYNISGVKDENLDFTMGPNTSAYYSCSAKLNGAMFVFGGSGSSQNTQVKSIHTKNKF